MFKKRAQKKSTVRNRTPRVEPSANKVFSYYNVRRPVEVDEAEEPSARKSRGKEVSKNNRHILSRRISFVLIAFLVIGAVLYNARLNPPQSVVTLKGTPEQRLLLQDVSVYKRGAEKIMQENFKNRTKFTFDGKSFSKAMVKQFPEISSANVSLPFIGSAPSIYIEPSSAALVFIAQDKKSYIVDNEGRIIANIVSSAPVGMSIVTDQSGLVPKVGSQVLPSNDVTAIQTIISQLREKQIIVDSLILPTAAQRLEVRVQGKPYYIKFNLHDNVAQQIGAYIVTQHKLDREGTTPREYIDVRVADRVYYK